MTNIVYQEIGCPVRYVYQGADGQTKNARIVAALEELSHVDNIAIFLYKRGKLRPVSIRRT